MRTFETNGAKMHVVTYHYVRDLPRTRFPRIKGMLVKEFREQVSCFSEHFKMARLEEAMAFLRGEFRPTRDLCLLTFDDGLKEHYTEVVPWLADSRIQGLFGIITSCVEERRVASVHMNHFLMAALPFCQYRGAFLEELHQEDGATWPVDEAAAMQSYPLDTREVASFKYLFNFVLEPGLRDRIVRQIFSQYFQDEKGFADELYMSWSDIRALQAAGMVIAGHTHEHNALSALSDSALKRDISTCRRILNERIHAQKLWPFSYPYGKKNSYSSAVISELKENGFDCAFNTEKGSNLPGANLFELSRTDCNGALLALTGRIAGERAGTVQAVAS